MTVSVLGVSWMLQKSVFDLLLKSVLIDTDTCALTLVFSVLHLCALKMWIYLVTSAVPASLKR